MGAGGGGRETGPNHLDLTTEDCPAANAYEANSRKVRRGPERAGVSIVDDFSGFKIRVR